MGKHIYKKQEAVDIRGLCVKCGKNPQKSKAPGLYKPICSPCDKKRHVTENSKATAKRAAEKVKRPYRIHVDDHCWRCGFVPVDLCQLDVHHIDHNHKNNDPENLITICANCHRLEHK